MNVTKLDKELRKAGIEISGVNSDGVVWDNEGIEIQTRKDVKSILDAHDPTPSANKYKGKKPKDLTADERNEILFAGMVDEKGNIK